jgi:hypothetical protein
VTLQLWFPGAKLIVSTGSGKPASASCAIPLRVALQHLGVGRREVCLDADKHDTLAFGCRQPLASNAFGPRGGDFSLPKPVGDAIPIGKPAGIWRMSGRITQWVQTGVEHD